MLYLCPTPVKGLGGLYISGVDFGCFSTVYGDCEALEEREEQMNFTLFVCMCTQKDQQGLCTNNEKAVILQTKYNGSSRKSDKE